MTTPSGRIALIGVGASTLVMALVSAGYGDIDAVDLSAEALWRLRTLMEERFGSMPTGLRLVEADARSVRFDGPVDLWHDRATFHFLTDPADQLAYAHSAAVAVRTGGHLIVAGFSPHGPQQCSGLPVVRHTAESLDTLFGGAFATIDRFEEVQVTPWGADQSFLYSVLRRR